MTQIINLQDITRLHYNLMQLSTIKFADLTEHRNFISCLA